MYYTIITMVNLPPVAVITGAGRGIGAACAHLFAEKGYRLAICSRTKTELHSVRDSIRTRFPNTKILIQAFDIQESPKVQDFFLAIDQEFGRVDVLVNNAAVLYNTPFLELTDAQWHQALQVNIMGMVMCSREAIKRMKKNAHGRIVNIASLSGIAHKEKFPGLSSYVVSKFGVVGLTEALAVECAPYGIQVNALAPGTVDTQMLQVAFPEFRAKTQPEDIASVIVFLCEDTSNVLNGSVIEAPGND